MIPVDINCGAAGSHGNGKHVGYRNSAQIDAEALEHLRHKLGGKPTPGTGKRKAEVAR